jgi:hypothetical protein
VAVGVAVGEGVGESVGPIVSVGVGTAAIVRGVAAGPRAATVVTATQVTDPRSTHRVT